MRDAAPRQPARHADGERLRPSVLSPPQLFTSPASPLHALVDSGALERLWTRVLTRADGRSTFEAWRLLNLGVWHELHWPTGLMAPYVENSASVDDLFREESRV